MQILLALSFTLLHSINPSSCRSFTKQLNEDHIADTVRESLESYELNREAIPNLLKQLLERTSSEFLDGERVQGNVGKLTIEPYIEEDGTKIKWKKRDSVRLPENRKETVAPLAIIVTNLPALTRLRGRGSAAKTDKVTSETAESNRNADLYITKEREVTMERDNIPNELIVTNKRALDNEKEIIKEEGVIKEGDNINDLSIAMEKDGTDEREVNNVRDVTTERSVNDALDVTMEKDTASKKDVSKERDITNELAVKEDVNKEKDITYGLDDTMARDVIKEKYDYDELEITKERDVSNELDVTLERDITKEMDLSNDFTIPHQKSSYKNNQLVDDQLGGHSYEERVGETLRDVDLEAKAEGGVVKKIIIEPDVKMEVVTEPGESSVASTGLKALNAKRMEGDVDWMQRQRTFNTYNISFLFNR